MRVLIAPMSAAAETGGPAGRCKLLAEGFKRAGIDVATCMADDVNFKKIEGVDNYYLDVPVSLGLPEFIGGRLFPVARKLGITSRKTVSSFEEVLHFTGNLDYRYLSKSVESILEAIEDFGPDVVYSEFNISALIAARLEGVRLCATVSYPTQYEYAHDDSLSKDLNRLLSELSLPKVRSALDLFDFADLKFCPSIRELEPIDKENVFFCGALKSSRAEKTIKDANTESVQRNRILVYMGNGTVSAAKMKQVVTDAFAESRYEVYIASSYLEAKNEGNIHIAPRWDFDRLLEKAVLFINHGGQNSVIDGLIHGVPQVMVPGKVFERKFNAKSVADNGAGIILPYDEFRTESLRNAAAQLAESEKAQKKAAALGAKLMAAGGVQTIARILDSSVEIVSR